MGVEVDNVMRTSTHAFIISHAILSDVSTRFVIGVDEAGRGALAGPVCVGAVLYPADFDWREIFSLVTRRGEPKLRDSKQLSAGQRTVLYDYIVAHERLRHASALVGATTIDANGIVSAAREATARALSRLAVRRTLATVLLDAGLNAPRGWVQRSFIRGDERIPPIALASIIAKVTRDRYMEALSDRYAEYGLEAHKGYGTRAHFDILRTLGPGIIHRVSFLKSLR